MIYRPFESNPHRGGTQDLYAFEGSHYGASVIRHSGSYGYPNNYELAVIEFVDAERSDWSICYDTPITNDVVGHLTPEEVQTTLAQIDALRGV
jgi:hypothetical protein